MTNEDRKKVFWLLQKYSSYTAWEALGVAYSAFLKAWEYAMKHADEDDIDEFNVEATKDILDGQIAFEKGLPRLRAGQRSVFRINSAGYLKAATSSIRFINRIMDPEEFVFDWMKNKDEVLEAHRELYLRSRICGAIFERPSLEISAALGRRNAFSSHPSVLNFPSFLPPVPTSTDTTVNTGEETPIDGIWEPEWDISPGLLKTLIGTAPKVEKGCMNYLLASTVAPSYQDGDHEKTFNVRWRLIWEDHRYEDGIPEAEKEYLLETTPAPTTRRLRALPKEIVPATGWWVSPAKPGGRQEHYFKAGDRFPDIHTTDLGSVIWGFEPEQQKDPPR